MTALDLKVLDYVREYIVSYDCAPTIAEIAEKVAVTPSAAACAVGRLEKVGCVRRTPGKHRSIVVTAVASLQTVPTALLRAELGRRGVTLDALAKPERENWSRRAVTCAADCCQIEVQRGMLFCRSHWFSLPRDLQTGIKRAFGRKDTATYGQLVTKARDLIDMGCAA